MRRAIKLLGAVALGACTSVYSGDSVLDATGRAQDEGYFLEYRVRSDTAFYSPGLRVERQGSAAQLVPVRCAVGRDCHVDLPATFDRSRFVYRVVLDRALAEQATIETRRGVVSVLELPSTPSQTTP